MKWIVVLLFFTAMEAAQAQSYRRLVNFEWEPIDGAKFYEIELRRVGETKTASFKSTTAEWSGRLQIGRYEFRLRALDQRKVPGDWSAYSALDVGLEPVQIAGPLPNSNIKAQDADKEEIAFSWQATPDAAEYKVEIFNSKNEKIHEEKTASRDLKIKLPTASQYSWKVKAISKDGLESESSQSADFTILGPKLAKVSVEKPDSEFVRELKWEPIQRAEFYHVVLAKLNPQTKKWQKFREIENLDKTSLDFESSWPGGRYKLMIKSKAALREDSESSLISFSARQGDRSPAAEYVMTLRKSIDRVNGWFAQGSWYASSISMNSQYRGVLGFNTNVITGTGRLGLGWFKPETKWGFMASMEASGYIFENRIYNFLGVELSAIHKQEVSERGDLRYQVGVFAREFPALWTTSASANSNFLNPNSVDRQYGKGGAIGPHLGAEYWYSLTPKLGLQTNIHVYAPMTGISFPNGGKMEGMSDVNYSLGALGSYRYSSRLTGLVGVTYKVESYTYTDNSDSAGWSSGVYQSSHTGKVKTEISGIYLNLMAEYSF